jgi:hypothetical protein
MDRESRTQEKRNAVKCLTEKPKGMNLKTQAQM